jgi:hypothetical protein
VPLLVVVTLWLDLTSRSGCTTGCFLGDMYHPWGLVMYLICCETNDNSVNNCRWCQLNAVCFTVYVCLYKKVVFSYKHHQLQNVVWTLVFHCVGTLCFISPISVYILSCHLVSVINVLQDRLSMVCVGLTFDLRRMNFLNLCTGFLIGSCKTVFLHVVWCFRGCLLSFVPWICGFGSWLSMKSMQTEQNMTHFCLQ